MHENRKLWMKRSVIHGIFFSKRVFYFRHPENPTTLDSLSSRVCSPYGLGLDFHDTTASGDDRTTNVYKGAIIFLDSEVEVPILSTDADFSLAGMELFHDCRIIIERNKDIVKVDRSK